MGLFDFFTGARNRSNLSIKKSSHTYPPRLDDADDLYLSDIQLWDRLAHESKSIKGEIGHKKVYTSWLNYIKSIADYNPPIIQRKYFGGNVFEDDSFAFAFWVECDFLDCRIHQKLPDESLEISVYLKYEGLSIDLAYFCTKGEYKNLLSGGGNQKINCLFYPDKAGKGVTFPADSRSSGFKEAFKRQAASGKIGLMYKAALIRQL